MSRHIRRTAAALVAAAAGLTLGPLAPADATTLTCGSIVTTDVTLTEDLLDCPGNGLVVAADGITVDLAGHTVSGMRTGYAGINVDDHDGVTVTGGVIAGFPYGVYAYSAGNLTVADTTVRGTIYGISVESSTDFAAEHARFEANRSAVNARRDVGLVLDGITVTGSTTDGISIHDTTGLEIINSTITGSAFDGLSLESTTGTVADNVIADNGMDGVYSIGVSDVTYLRNRASTNEDHGIRDQGGSSTWQDNLARRNGTAGLVAESATVVDLGGNRATGGRLRCIGLVCR